MDEQQAGQTAERVKEQAGQVTTNAKQQVSRIREEATHQGRRLAERTGDEVRNQAQTQTDRVASSLQDAGRQVRALAEGRPDDAGRARELSTQLADSLTDVGERIEGMGLDGVVDEVTRFARRRPGTFLVGTAAAGFVLGRMLRNADRDKEPASNAMPAPPEPSDEPDVDDFGAERVIDVREEIVAPQPEPVAPRGPEAAR